MKLLKTRKLILIALAIISGLLLITYIIYKKDSEINNVSQEVTSGFTKSKINIKNHETYINNSIDSILFTFGIKKEWITTDTSKLHSRTNWFAKTVLIPNDITSVEVNLDISALLNESGLSSKVTEDILSKDIIITVNNPDSSINIPAAIIQVKHSDKIKRESGNISIIIDKINEFSSKDLDKLIINKNEFSYIFPRNLDDIDVQHKLLQHKMDIVINMLIGSSDNFEVDFNNELDDKAISEKVKNFNADYPTVNKVLLTKSASTPVKALLYRIAAEFGKYNITVINDTMITPAYKPDENDKLGIFFSNLIQKVNSVKNIIAVIPLDASEFEDFYSRVSVYKKLGYKFMNLTEYINRIKEEQKREAELQEKLKQEQEKKKLQDEKKKKEKKVIPKKDTKKKTEKKKK